MPSVLKCPACHHPLSCATEVLAGQKVVYVYCGYGPCEPSWIGTGVPGKDEDESFKELEKAYEEWIGKQPE